MPLTIADEIHRQGGKVFLLAVPGITPQDLINKADEYIFIQLTQVGKAIRACLKHDVKELIMAGRIRHRFVFSLSFFKFDWTTLRIWLSLPDFRTDNLLHGIVDAFERKGVHVIDSTKYLKKYLAKEGLLTKLKPSSKVLDDIIFGKDIAKAMGQLDIGQTVVVKNKTIVAVEAMEGTDSCLERAGHIAGSGCVVVKMAKPNQDMRFDVPVIGINTIQKLNKIGAAALAIEKDKTLLIDAETIDIANQLGLVIVSL
ncbi:MAG: UDP-2,3-diacylglucosamine diphosphatase LpxI [Parachlamydiales bacterium]|nr:UDP-2,3-diacylglucosamine diphosphatase LpxI [Parachlamydiales bacterium]